MHVRIHSKLLDKAIGFKIQNIEKKLLKKYRPYYKVDDDSSRKRHYQGTQTWIGLHPQALQTPYNDILDALSVFHKVLPEKVIDFGAGYGRVGIVMKSLYPNAEFIGYEILEERMTEGNRIFEKLNLDNCIIKDQNILDDNFKIPEADIYFIYDFSEVDDLNKILLRLRKISEKKDFYLIAKGERVHYLINRKFKDFRSVNFANDDEFWSIFTTKKN